ncbi:ATP-dependent 6-phosphofructokinase [Candidatus Margulisiibacteriota bacterium]
MTKKKKIKTIGLVTPGGDAPGMNTAIRAVVRTAIYHKLKVYGISKGWHGLITGQIDEMNIKSVSGIINKGSTILGSHRTKEFRDKNMRQVAYKNLKERFIDALIVIGGDGSLRAANVVSKETDLPVIHIPASIDNDISCTDYTIGFDTAVNTAVDAIDKIRDTASAFNRVFVVEVMGKRKGLLAVEVGLVCGAEAIVIPEVKFNLSEIAKRIKDGQRRGKASFIIVLAEGVMSAEKFAEKLRNKVKKVDVKISVLGHMQRGGSPTAISRELACKMGARAVECLLNGCHNIMIGGKSEELVETPFAKVIRTKMKVDLRHIKLAEMLAI